jgi:hypothetical protein
VVLMHFLLLLLLHSRKHYVAELHMWGTLLATLSHIRLSFFIEQLQHILRHLRYCGKLLEIDFKVFLLFSKLSCAQNNPLSESFRKSNQLFKSFRI